MSETILIVDDEKSLLKALRITLEGKYGVITTETGSNAIKLFQHKGPDLVLLDIGLPDMSGIVTLKEIKEKDPDAMVIMVTAVEDVKTIVEAVKLGAYDYLVKPINSQELFLTVKNAIESRQLKNQIRLLQQADIDRYKFEIIGRSPEIKKMIKVGAKGTYHITSEGFCSRYKLAEYLVKKLNLKIKLKPCRTTDYPQKAKRPLNCILENRLLKQQGLNIMPDWKQDLDLFIEKYGYKLIKEATEK